LSKLFLSFQAVDLAVRVTEQFLNDLRSDVGDNNFDRLFSINPSQALGQAASNAVAKGQRFRFFTPLLSASLKKTDSLIMDIKNAVKNCLNGIKSILTSFFSSKKNVPTYDLSDLKVNVTDADNFHAAPYILTNGIGGRKRRLIDVLRKH
jgi:hypothetical protein